MKNMERCKSQKKRSKKLKSRKPQPPFRATCSCNDRFRLGSEHLLSLVLAALLVNCVLCLLGTADSYALSERLGTVFYMGCGALIRNWMGQSKNKI